MKEYIKNIIAESLKDEVDVDREWERLFSSIEKKTISKMKTRRLFLQYLKYAAAVVLGIGVSLSTLYLTNQEILSTVGNYKLVTSKGEKSYLQLPDGTKVWLNSCTTLEYAENYGYSNRSIYLDGEAYFEVSANKNKPFYVHTSKGEIKVLGTHFNLEAYSNADVFKTSLFEGKVRVRVKGNNIYLKPDQMVCYHKNGKIHLETIHDYDQFRWREGLICIKSAKLKDIMKTFTKYFGDSIVVQNKEVEHYKYTGKFRQSRGVINALRLLQKDAPFTIEQDEDKQIIYIK